MKTGIELIFQERREQLEKHKISIQSDAYYNRFSQLVDAAGAMLLKKPTMKDIPSNWDESQWLKMIQKPYRERLIISAALIAAELDRELYEENNSL
jgi:hypothetical protein